MVKVLHVMFSTNRMNYLPRTLQAQQQYLDFSELEVHKLFIDDYPLGRNNQAISSLVRDYGFSEVLLHWKNMGITSTWNELFQIVKTRDYDYILHQEDDVEPTETIKVSDLIYLLETNPDLSQIQLKRNYWFKADGPESEWYGVKNNDIAYKNYYLEKGNPWFWMLMSIYPKWIAEIDYVNLAGACPSEGVLSNYMQNVYNKKSGILKNHEGKNLVHHFGEVTKGKRVNPGEPGWEGFQYYDPNKEYYSRTGHEVKHNSSR
jgi:hypothetical protein